MLLYCYTEKQKEMTLYLPEPTLSGSFVCYDFMHYLFKKVFYDILIQKFQNYSPQAECLALYMSLFLNIYWCKKYFIFLIFQSLTNTHFQDHLQIPNVQIISWLPRNTRLDIPHYKIFTNAIQNLT